MVKSKDKNIKVTNETSLNLESYETCDLSWLDWKSISANISK